MRATPLNVLWTDGDHFVGSRLNRTLWLLERDDIFVCPICGKSHVHHRPHAHSRSVEVSSEPVSEGAWREVANESIFSIDADLRIEMLPLST